MNRSRTLAVAIVAVAGGIAWWAWSGGTEGDAPNVAVRWREHSTYRYDVDYAQRHRLATASLLGADDDASRLALAVDTDLDATLEVEWRGRVGEHVVLALRFAEVERASVVFGGTELLPTREAIAASLLGHELLFEVADDGEVTTIHVDPGAPELFSNLARMMVGELQVRTAGPVGEWSATEHDPLGSAHVDYALASSAGDALTIDKRRDRYTSWLAMPSAPREDRAVEQDLAHQAAIEISREGDLRGIEAEQSLEASDGHGTVLDVQTKSRLALLAIAPAAPRPEPIAGRLATRRAYRMDETLDSPLAERSLLTQQAAGLTWAVLRAGVLDFGEGDATSKTYADLAWQATALLEMNPALCDQLVPLFTEAAADRHRRGFILDLLGHVDHEHAQAAMLAMLRSDAARADADDHARFVQRLGLVRHPSAETTAYVREALRDAKDPDLLIASAYTLGSVVSHMDASDEADASNAILVEMLAQPDDDALRAIAARALANTRRVANVEVLTAATGDAHGGVRLAVTDALTRFDTADAHAALAELAGDEDVRVQGLALGGLARRADAAHDRQVGESIASGRISPWNYREALAVLDRIDDEDLRRRALQHMASSTVGDPSVRSLVHDRLQTLGG
jgi:hypothetical protein